MILINFKLVSGIDQLDGRAKYYTSNHFETKPDFFTKRFSIFQIKLDTGDGRYRGTILQNLPNR